MHKHIPRTLALSCVLCLMSFVSKAQWVTIPDANFVAYLQANFPSCMNGNLMDTTCSSVLATTYVNCNHSNIQNLTGIEYFDNLQVLYCNANYQLSFLPSLPETLTSLNCQDCSLTYLPDLPSLLSELICPENQLSFLPYLPNSLTFLNCDFNQISILPTLPLLLTDLHCNYNELTILPTLPNSLKIFGCNFNHLTALPGLPNSLVVLDCSYNELSNIPELPDSLYFFSCHYNANLKCLPQLKKIRDFTYFNTGITCLPNYPQSNISCNPAYNSLAICGIFNNNCPTPFWNISGKVYNDANSNCTDDVSESSFGNFPVKLSSGGVFQQQVYTGSEGFYSFDTNYGNYTYTVDTTGLPVLVTCPVSGSRSSNITALDSFDFSMDFGMRCKPGFDVGAWSNYTTTVFRPGNTTTVHVDAGDYARFFGIGCASVSGQVVITFSGPVTYLSNAGALSPSSVVGNTITYNIADFSTVNVFSSFGFALNTNTNAQAGQQVCISVSVTPVAGDNNPANNSLTHCFTVVNSYDPNVKEVYPIGNFRYDSIPEWLTYTVHFQNTGTAPAQHIYITDTLDTDLDASSFQLLAHSHEGVFQVLQGNKARFNFPNINLPDSLHNEPDSHGWIQYRIKPKQNLLPGTDIANTANIYFDFNAPVVTNTTHNVIECYSTTHSASAAACGTEVFDFYGTALDTNGVYLHTLHNVYGCDSLIELNFARNEPSTATISTSICEGESFSIGLNTHYTLGTYIDIISNSNGCDSIVTLNLSVNAKDSAATSQSICAGDNFNFYGTNLNNAGFYTHVFQNANGCDSIVGLQLAVNAKDSTSVSQSICDGDSYNFFGANLSSAGDYAHLLQNMKGCDSVVLLSLTTLSVYTRLVDVVTQDSSYTLPSGMVVTESGTYIDTLVASNTCDSIITTFLHLVTGLTPLSLAEGQEVRLYPNPATNSIKFLGQEKELKEAKIKIYNTLGVVVYELDGVKNRIDVSRFADGIYLIKIEAEGTSKTAKFIKE